MLIVNLKKSISKLVLGIALFATQFNLVAQDVEVSDDELTRYVSVMAQIDTLKAEMKITTSELVKGNELMDKGRAFNAIKKAKGDSLAIAGLGMSQDQLMAFDEINTQINTMTAAFKEKYTSLIKDDLGASVYNKIKKGLKNDEALKSRYNEAVLKAQTTPSEEVETEG